MTQANKKGLWLRPAEQAKTKNTGWILHTVMILLTYAATMLTAAELAGFHRYEPVLAALALGVFLCMLYGILRAGGRQGIFYPGVLMLLLLVLFFRQQIMDGFCLAWNQMGDTWTASTGWVLPELQTDCASQAHDGCLILFSLAAGCVGSLLCCLMVSAAAPVLAAALPMLLAAGTVCFGSHGNLRPVLMIAALLLLYSGWEKEKPLPGILGNWTAFVLTVCILAAAATLPSVGDWASECSRSLHERFHERNYETKYTTLPEGDFIDYRQAGEDAKPALVVTMEKPEQMYLRGFTGAVFDGDTWSSLDTQVLAENEDLLYWLNLNEFNPSRQFESAVFADTKSMNLITVQNIGACSRYYYLPFSLSSNDLLQSENLNTDCIAADGERIYSFFAVAGSAGQIRQVLDVLQTSEEEAVLQYRKAESAYRAFVYDSYLQIPQAAMELLEAEWESYGTRNDLTRGQAQASVCAFLNRCHDGQDLELPLPQAAGTSYQTATVAVLTLRYFGIPARYAEGYVITEAMAEECGSGASMEVDSACARAWAEVYQDGIGWIPLDLTAGMDGQGSGEGDNSADTDDPDDENQQIQEGQGLEEDPEEEQQMENPQGGSLTTVPKAAAWTGILILLTLLLLAAALAIRRKIVLNRREKKFGTGNCSEAVAWIMADTVALLEALDFARGNGSLVTLYEPVRQRFGEGYASAFRHAIDLNSAAMFSSRTLTEEQKTTVLEFRTKTLQYLQTEMNRIQRLRMKWIDCRF